MLDIYYKVKYTVFLNVSHTFHSKKPNIEKKVCVYVTPTGFYFCQT